MPWNRVTSSGDVDRTVEHKQEIIAIVQLLLNSKVDSSCPCFFHRHALRSSHVIKLRQTFYRVSIGSRMHIVELADAKNGWVHSRLKSNLVASRRAAVHSSRDCQRVERITRVRTHIHHRSLEGSPRKWIYAIRQFREVSYPLFSEGKARRDPQWRARPRAVRENPSRRWQSARTWNVHEELALLSSRGASKNK